MRLPRTPFPFVPSEVGTLLTGDILCFMSLDFARDERGVACRG